MSPDHICDRLICPAGRSLYIVMVTFGEVAATICGQRVADLLQIVGRGRVDVGDAELQQHHRHRGVPVVDDGGLVLVGRIPQRLIGILQRADVGGHLIGPPADAGRVDGVGHAVLPVLVVPGVGEERPDVLDVRDVAVVERPHQTTGHQSADLVVAREEDVVIDVAAADLGQRLVGVVERRDLDLDAVLVLERLDRFGCHVVGVAVELQRRALLRTEAVGDRLVVRRDVPFDRAAGRRDRQARGRSRLSAFGTRVQECHQSRGACGQQRGPLQKLSAVRAGSIGNRHPHLREFRVLSHIWTLA